MSTAVNDHDNYIECEKIYEFICQHPGFNDLSVMGRAHGAFDVQNLGSLQKLKSELLANSLTAMQSQHDKGQGFALRAIAHELRNNRIRSAVAIARAEWDTVARYPEVATWLQENEIADKSWAIPPVQK